MRQPDSCMEIKFLKTARTNYSDQSIKPQYIIIHCIGGTEAWALNTLTKPLPEGGGVSSHYFIGTSGLVYNLVPPDKLAFHAGASQWHDINQLNHYSIGIEFHCPNYANALQGPVDWYHFEAFDDVQIQTGVALIKALMKQYAILPQNILAHSDIAPWRTNAQGETILGKTDPGASFPWAELSHQGIGVWPRQERIQTGIIDLSVASIQHLLKKVGYNVPVNGVMDQATQYTIKAFQLHYMPQCIGKGIDEAMVTLLENLAYQSF